MSELTNDSVRASGPHATGQTADGGSRYQVEFHGSGSEYFKIWIVNVFLTIITVYVFSAWAKVRTKRYFMETPS